MEKNEEFKQAAFPNLPLLVPSRLAISFGSPQNSNLSNKSSKISLLLTLSKEESEKQLLSLTKSIKNKEDPNYAIIFDFTVLPENQTEFLKTLDELTSFSSHMTELTSALNELIKTKQIVFESFLDKELNKVYMIMKLGSSFEEVAASQIKLFSFLGLEKILKETNNSIEITLSTENMIKSIINSIKTKKLSIFSAFLQQISLEVVLKSSPTFIQDLFSLIDNMGVLQFKDKGISFSILSLLMKKLKGFDIDIQLEGTDKLDEAFKRRFLDSLGSLEKVSIDKRDEKVYKSIMKCVEGEFGMFFTMGEVCGLKMKVKIPDFMDLFNYFTVSV